MPDSSRSSRRTTPDHATWPRRIGAFVVDQIVAVLSTMALIGPQTYLQGDQSQYVAFGVFVVEVTVMTAFAAGSIGQLLMGIRVLRLDGRPLNLLQALARTILKVLIVPPLIFRSDSGRGLHDLAVGSASYLR